MSRPTKALVNLQALRHNYHLAKQLSEGRIIAVVKADAYSHGATRCAQALNDVADAFAVACLEEALALRDAHIEQPIIVLEGFFDISEMGLIEQHRLDVVIHCQQQLALLTASSIKQPMRVWLKMDTGMSRLGFSPAEYRQAWKALQSLDFISEIVMMTHFACADELTNIKTAQQLEIFKAQTSGLPGSKSIANSAGIIAHPEARAEWNRPGLMLYGVSPFPEHHLIEQSLQPVMTLHSAIISIKDIPVGQTVGYGGSWVAKRPTRVGVVAIGYADGYPLHAKEGTCVLIGDQKAPLIGRVSMDMITVDLTDLANTQVGTPVMLWGNNLPVAEIAHCADTIPYQLLCNLSRLPVEYINEPILEPSD
ncbi:MAG: alanine racemase [Endozoicomonas sp. (ex Botrylloides leachii)]|nr:alanine racemase [Endozoicomonas sp. (ex Botrylloides leachii)]